MRFALSITLLIVGTATLVAAAPYGYSPARVSTPPPPPASAQDLQRARKLADQASRRLQQGPRQGNGWAYGATRRR